VEVVGVFSALTIAELVEGLFEEDEGSGSDFAVREELDAVACLAAGVMIAEDSTFPLVGASTVIDFGMLTP